MIYVLLLIYTAAQSAANLNRVSFKLEHVRNISNVACLLKLRILQPLDSRTHVFPIIPPIYEISQQCKVTLLAFILSSRATVIVAKWTVFISSWCMLYKHKSRLQIFLKLKF